MRKAIGQFWQINHRLGKYLLLDTVTICEFVSWELWNQFVMFNLGKDWKAVKHLNNTAKRNLKAFFFFFGLNKYIEYPVTRFLNVPQLPMASIRIPWATIFALQQVWPQLNFLRLRATWEAWYWSVFENSSHQCVSIKLLCAHSFFLFVYSIQTPVATGQGVLVVGLDTLGRPEVSVSSRV